MLGSGRITSDHRVMQRSFAICYHAVKAAQRLAEQIPDEMARHCTTWGPSLWPLLLCSSVPGAGLQQGQVCVTLGSTMEASWGEEGINTCDVPASSSNDGASVRPGFKGRKVFVGVSLSLSLSLFRFLPCPGLLVSVGFLLTSVSSVFCLSLAGVVKTDL